MIATGGLIHSLGIAVLAIAILGAIISVWGTYSGFRSRQAAGVSQNTQFRTQRWMMNAAGCMIWLLQLGLVVVVVLSNPGVAGLIAIGILLAVTFAVRIRLTIIWNRLLRESMK